MFGEARDARARANYGRIEAFKRDEIAVGQPVECGQRIARFEPIVRGGRDRRLRAERRAPERRPVAVAFGANKQFAIACDGNRLQADIGAQTPRAIERGPRRCRAERAVAVQIVDANALALLEAHREAPVGQLR